MADPRLDVSIVGVGAVYASFKIDDSTITYDATKDGGSSQVGLAVALSAAETVELVGDGEEVVGKLISVESDDIATVQIAGGMTLPGGSGASLTLGKKIVGALNALSAEGYIREVAVATAAELGLARGFIVNAGTTTEVEVYL
jgi:hypothetical protein